MNVTTRPPQAPDDGMLGLDIDDPAGLNHGPSETYPEALYRSVARGPDARVAVDLGAVDLLSSRGVRVLVNLKRRVERDRGRLVLFRLRPYVRHQLRVTNLAAHFPVADDRPAALAFLRTAPSL
jgi:anti-sigma B factor antagonist